MNFFACSTWVFSLELVSTEDSGREIKTINDLGLK